MKGESLLSLVPMRAEPSDKAEMVNQILYGETFEIIDNQEKWNKIRLDHDGYEGWIDNKQWQVTNSEKMLRKPLNKLMLLNKNSRPQQIFSMGSLILERKSLVTSKKILPTALQFLGVPYLWGGRSFMGIDCSGFTQVVFRVSGKTILRDANQQAGQGKSVAFNKAKEGDLAFFKNDMGRVVHVGIIFKENEKLKIIHASGKVRIDLLDEKGIFNEETKTYTHTFHSIKRIRR